MLDTSVRKPHRLQLNPVKVQWAFIRDDRRQSPTSKGPLGWVGAGPRPVGARKPGPRAQHLCNNPVCLKPSGLAPLRVAAPGIPRAELTRGLGWVHSLGTHAERAAASQTYISLSLSLFFFFFNFKGKGRLGSLHGVSPHLAACRSKAHSWSVNARAVTAKETLRLRKEI